MDNKTLRILLEKFYRGETALGEEELLRKHLAGQEETRPEFETDRMLLQLTQMQKEVEAGTPDIEESLSKFLDMNLSEKTLFRSRRSVYRYAAAAAIVLSVGISSLLLLRNPDRSPTDTFSDPQLAYREVESTLAFVSERINTGMEPLSNVDKIKKATAPLKALDAIEENLGRAGLVSFVNLNSDVQK